MTHNYSANQIIKYLYQELPLTERLEAEYAISAYPEWNSTYKALKLAFDQLPKVQFFPSRKSIKKIMAYSAATAEA